MGVRYNRNMYYSDWIDVFSDPVKVFSSACHVFFVVCVQSITFATFLSNNTNNEMGLFEIFFSNALSSIITSFFSGQPLNIVGVSGPTVLLITLLYHFSRLLDYPFLPFLSCVQLWAAFFHILLTAVNACDLVVNITTFATECYGTLLGLIFIYCGLQGLWLCFNDDYDSENYTYFFNHGVYTNYFLRNRFVEVKEY